MRVYVRVERVLDLGDLPKNASYHVNIIMESVRMRTRSHRIDNRSGVITFEDDVHRRFNEMFVLHARSSEHLFYLTLKLQLRKERFLRRSENLGEVKISLALLDAGRSLFGSFPVAPKGSDTLANTNDEQRQIIDTVKAPKLIVRVEVEEDVEVIPSTMIPPSAEAIGVKTELTAETNDLVISKTEVIVPPTDEESATRKRSASERRRALPKCSRGTQTDRLTFDRQDAARLTSDIDDVPSRGGLVTSSLQVIDLPPPSDVTRLRDPNNNVLPLEAEAFKRTVPAFPQDEIEGLLLFCEHTKKQKVEMERNMARYHLGRALSKARAVRTLGAVAQSTGPTEKLPRDESQPLMSPLQQEAHTDSLATMLSPHAASYRNPEATVATREELQRLARDL